MEVSDLMTEAELLKSVIELAHLRGWLVEHKRPARLQNGEWRSAIQGSKGGPDLLLAKNGRVIVAELKAQKGKLTPEQQEWVIASGAYVWRPSDWLNGEIERVLA